jgi:RimJ/RimL family protein N-acetyltransferase
MLLDAMWESIAKRLEGRRVVLDPLRPEHAEAVRKAGADPAAWRWMAVTNVEEWLSGHAFVDDRVPFATLYDGELVGSTSYLSLAPEHRRLEIGNTWVNPGVWGAGVNIEAKLLMLRYAFEELGALRVEFKTDALNERARAALAALPAQFEGIHLRHMLVRGGERRDSAWYSVIVDDWPAVETNLERRLAGRD